MVARGVQVALLLAFAAIQAMAFVDELAPGQGFPLKRYFWVIQWEMFTRSAPNRSRTWFEGDDGTGWAELPMEEWYPATWDEGHRWDRPNVINSKSAQVPFLVAACKRSGDDRVRMVRRIWRKTMDPAVEGKELSRKVLSTRECSKREQRQARP